MPARATRAISPKKTILSENVGMLEVALVRSTAVMDTSSRVCAKMNPDLAAAWIFQLFGFFLKEAMDVR